MTEVTQILCAIEQGDPKAAEQLPLVYDERRCFATQKMALNHGSLASIFLWP